jgi:endoglucanase
MLGRLSTVVALLAASASGTIYYAGVAESGGEFGVYSMYRKYQEYRG